MDARLDRWRIRIIQFLRHGMYFGRRLPPGIRALVGIILVLAGIIGLILPVPGIWIIMLGIALVAMEFPVLRRRQFRWLQQARLRYRPRVNRIRP
ncbi:MAG: PGPGW domain-containing protein [Alphaproteobacteria bacterium]